MNIDKYSLPSILYLADFPPSSLNGGAILLSRLFNDYPSHKITVLAGSNYVKTSPVEGRLNCEHIIFPITNGTGPWGVGRIKQILNWFLLPFLCFVAGFYLLRRRSRIIISVAHGHFFVAAAILTAIFKNKSLILFIHDDWVELQTNKIYIFRSVYSFIFRMILKEADHIYVISHSMQKKMKDCYKVRSEFLLPGHEPVPAKDIQPYKPESICMVYAGNLTGTIMDNLEILIKMLREKILEKVYGITNFSAIFFTRGTGQHIMQRNVVPSVIFRDWLTQEKLIEELQRASILFLPFSFSNEQREIVKTSLPTKSSDYLASGRPILVFAPPYSSLFSYAKEYGFAETVDEPSPLSLAKGIYNIVSSQKYQEELKDKALKTFELNHDIVKQKMSFINNLTFLL